MMINDSDCGIIHVSWPCFSVQGVIAGDNSFSIIHIAPTLYWEHCHTAAICLDLISLRRDGAEEKVRERRTERGETVKKAKVKQRKRCFAWKLCKHSSNIVCCRTLVHSTASSLHAPAARRRVWLCVQLLGKHPYIGCVPGDLVGDVIVVLQSHVCLFVVQFPPKWVLSLDAQIKTH